MAGDREDIGITLADGVTGGQLLSGLLRQAAANFPEAFAGLALPSSEGAFRSSYGSLLPAFEALRVQSQAAGEIARSLCISAAAQLRFVDQAGSRTLPEALSVSVPPLPLVRVDLPDKRGLMPAVDYAGRLYVGGQLSRLAEELDQARFATRAAVSALTEVGARAEADGGLSLRGERFVLLGAGAELSPVYTLLEAGADVLWLDRERPPIDRLLEPRLGGALSYVDRGIDLLTQPAAVRATILDFAQGSPLHVGLYAFARHRALPLRLALGMNELVRSLPAALVKSLTFLLSPTSVNFIYPEDGERADQRAKSMSTMRRALLRTGQLQPGYTAAAEQRISAAVVSPQGAAYQVGEYVGKRLAAEAFCEFGSALDGRASDTLFVSANMAPVSRTRSLASPVLTAAILGAPSFDMLIAQASTARAVSSLLAVHDVLEHPRKATRGERQRSLFARQFHGGVHAQPYALDGIIRVAALKGIAQRPKLALELLR